MAATWPRCWFCLAISCFFFFLHVVFSYFSPSPLQLTPHNTNEEDLKDTTYYKVSFLSPVSESSLLTRSISLTIVSNVIKRASVLVRQEGEKSEIKALWFTTSQYVIPGQRELVLSQHFWQPFFLLTLMQIREILMAFSPPFFPLWTAPLIVFNFALWWILLQTVCGDWLE